MAADRVDTGRVETGNSLGSLIGGLATDVQHLIRGEIALARSELDQKLDHAMSALIWLVGGALLGFAGLVVFLQGVAFLLALVMPVWLAELIVGVVIAAIGAILARSAIAKLSLKNLTPDRTATQLKKDAGVVKEHI